jgi:hypothetical protein
MLALFCHMDSPRTVLGCILFFGSLAAAGPLALPALQSSWGIIEARFRPCVHLWFLLKSYTMHQINRQSYVHRCLDNLKNVAIPPHLLDLGKSVTPKGHIFVLAVPFYTLCNIRPVYFIEIYLSGMPCTWYLNLWQSAHIYCALLATFFIAQNCNEHCVRRSPTRSWKGFRMGAAWF